ncbi:hypothetical protein F3Y18_01595 [Klebsiella pneumoniae]|nr:hypothetical protein F3Y18_01595 [Klebsiella pneumoniae]KAA8883401.1 hypothetical protein F3Y19_01595 [Klebsiella pneumoniae]
MFAGKKSAQIREILISESAWEEMTCLFAPSSGFLQHYEPSRAVAYRYFDKYLPAFFHIHRV